MKNKGFTLIELMIVLSIVGIFGVLIVPKITDKAEQLQVQRVNNSVEGMSEKIKNLKLSEDFKTKTEEYLQVTKKELKKLKEDASNSETLINTKEDVKKKESKSMNEGIKYGLSKVNMTYEKANCSQINSLQIECTENSTHALCTKSYYGYDCKIK